ncbi:MAG: hypothetical protein ACP5HZ_05360 [Ferrimicrobium sp.]
MRLRRSIQLLTGGAKLLMRLRRVLRLLAAGARRLVRLRHTILLLAGGAFGLTWTYLEAQSHTFTRRAEVLTGIAIAVVVVVFFRKVQHEAPRPFDRVAVWTWSLAALAVLTFELFNLFGGARPSHPTISSIINGALGYGIEARVILFVAWLGLGVWLAICGA